MIGTVLGRYEITGRLGAGGMGEVYLARDADLDRLVALKLLPEALRRDPEARRRFLREARAAAAIDHPYICKIYEVDTEGEIEYIAMEYVEGRTLRGVLAEGPLPVAEALSHACELAEALEKAHAKGFIHRDLKPANVMLTPDGHVKVMDFGLARQVHAAPVEDDAATMTLLTELGTIVGTPAYMSPEQLRGEPLDPRTDLFSFGVLLHEMLTGVQPFLRPSSTETQAAILRESAELPSHVDVAPEIARLVPRLLAKSREERPASFSEVTRLLRSLTGSSAQARRTTPSTGRRRGLMIAATAGALVLVGLAVSMRLDGPQGAPAGTATVDLTRLKVGELEARARLLMENFGDLDDLRASLAVWQQIRELEPDYLPALTGLANSRSMIAWNASPDPELLDRAQAEAEEALGIDPESADAHVALGALYMMRGLLDAAEKMSARSIELAPDDPWVLQSRARILMDRFGRFDEAEELARRATRLAPDSFASWFQLGWAQMERESFDESLESFRRAIELRPNFSAGHLGRGVLSMALGNHEDAETSLDETLRINPDSLQGRIFRGMARVHLGDLEGAAEDLRRVMLEHPQHGLVRHAQVWLALCLAELGEREASESLLEEAELDFKAVPGTWLSDVGLAAVAAVRGETEEAFLWLEKAVEAGLPSVVMVRNDPALALLHDDRRFDGIVARLRSAAEQI